MTLPVEVNPLLLGANQGYQISRSVRLRSSASAYFNRTPASATNRKTWTWSGWVKRGQLSTASVLFSANADPSLTTTIQFQSSDVLRFYTYAGGASQYFDTSAVLRDPSSYYHLTAVHDTTQAVAADRLKIYINGIQATGTTTGAVAQNSDGYVNAVAAHNIGRFTGTSALYFDGYLTEINFIDGQALTPASFGETDAVTGVWKPKKYAGTYGTNGFYLNFSDNSAATAAAIGKDYSGNGNNWTPNNISVTSGATYDSMLDVPTMWADGGNGRGNYAVASPVNGAGTALTLASGNLDYTRGTAAYGHAVGTMSIVGKTYFEITINGTGAGRNMYAGVGSSGSANSYSAASFFGADATAWSLAYSNATAYISNNGTQNAQAGTVANGDVFMYAVDPANGRIWFGRNGTWYAGDPAAGTGASYTNLPAEVFPVFQAYNSGAHSINFGQRPFAYTPPTGFKALNTQNLPEPLISNGRKWFDATTYTGNGSTLSVINSGFQPDFVWLKGRSVAYDSRLFDSVRGAQNSLISNLTNAESTGTAGVTSFDSSGFTLGSYIGTNQSAATYVGWQWKESATAGFDIVTFTNTASSASFNHSLGVTPAMIILKGRGPTAANWSVFHKSLANMTSAFLGLNTTNAVGTLGTAVPAPTSTTFGSSAAAIPASESSVAYLFAEVAGFSRFGSYTGNGSTDGPFVFCGFRPRWIMIKRTDTAGFDWFIYDSSRDTYNVAQNNLRPNTSGAESAQAANYIDLTSNGFKLRGDNTGSINNTSGTFIFAAFAENPFKYSLAR